MLRLSTLAVLALFVLALVPGTAAAYTCGQHYDACLRYNHGPTICGCAKRACTARVGGGDAGLKWDSIPGIKACWRKK
jgi:hypothetical protein